jgi:endonuclease YncB( thermonuclease family)
MTPTTMLLAAIAVAILWYCSTRGIPHFARTIHVVDGDSVETPRRNGVNRLRVHGIDAPEYHTQPHGRESRTGLVEILSGRTVLIIPCGKDSYGRILCRMVTARGSVACALAWRGHAWGQTATTLVISCIARLRHRGLWRAGGAVEPRLWRLSGIRHPSVMRARRR